MTVNRLQTALIGNGNEVVSNADDLAVFAMCSINGGELLALFCVRRQPKIAEFGYERTRDILVRFVCSEVRDNVIHYEPEWRSDGKESNDTRELHRVRLTESVE